MALIENTQPLLYRTTKKDMTNVNLTNSTEATIKLRGVPFSRMMLVPESHELRDVITTA